MKSTLQVLYSSNLGKKDYYLLKTFITDDTMVVEKKFKDSYNCRNNMNIIMATNDFNMLQIDMKSRRCIVLRCNNKYAIETMQSKDYFEKLIADLNANNMAGIKALKHYFMKVVNIKGFGRGQNPPESIMNSIIQIENMNTVYKWFYDCLCNGSTVKQSDLFDKHTEKTSYFYNDTGRTVDPTTNKYDSSWICEIAKTQLYTTYKRSTPKDYVKMPMFYTMLQEILPNLQFESDNKPIQHRFRLQTKVNSETNKKEQKRPCYMYVILPKYNECCDYFEKILGLKIDRVDVVKNAPYVENKNQNKFIKKRINSEIDEFDTNCGLREKKVKKEKKEYEFEKYETVITDDQYEEWVNDLDLDNLESFKGYE